MTTTSRVAIAGLLAAALVTSGPGCGRREREREPAAASHVDCEAFTARLRTCATAYWAAYAGTDRARAHAISGDVLGHAAEVRATFEAVGLDKLCENERTVHGDAPAWTRAVGDCMARPDCAGWAACAAPALVAAPAR